MDTQSIARWLRQSPWAGIAGSFGWSVFRLLLAILLLGALASYCRAQDKDEYYEQLFSPIAGERQAAAYKYAELCTIKDLTSMLYGYQTKYWNDTEYEYTDWPAQPAAFAEVIGFWPPCIDKEFVDKLYTYENINYSPNFELEYVIAAAVAKHAMRFDSDTMIALKARDYWYTDWLALYKDRVNGLVWRDLYRSIVAIPWLYDRVLLDDQISWAATVVLAAFADGIDKLAELYPTAEYYPWTFKLAEHLHRGADLPEKVFPYDPYGCTVWTDLGCMMSIDLFAILCDRQDWLPTIDVLLSAEQMTTIKYYHIPPFGLIPRPMAPTNELIRDKTPKESLERFFLGNDPWPYTGTFTESALLHHPWFASLRNTEDFESWWNEWNHDVPFAIADPTFGVPCAG